MRLHPGSIVAARRRAGAALALLLWVAGCGAHSAHPAGTGDDAGSAAGELSIQPADPVLLISNMTPAHQAFQAFQGGQDVTAQAIFVVDNQVLGSFQGATFTSAAGAAGKTQVRARLAGMEAQTSLTIQVQTVVVTGGAPPDAPSYFGGAVDPALALAVAYPPSGALIPPNLNELEVQWDRKSLPEDGVYELAFHGDALDLKIYAVCTPAGSGCGFTPDENTWKLLSNAGRGRTLAFTVRGTTHAKKGGAIGESPTQTLSFTEDDIQGGLYYWAASSGGVYRYDFGRRGQTAESFYDPARAGGAMCVGCHALSRNGKTIAVGLNIPGPSVMRTLDVASRKQLFQVGNGLPGGPGSDYEALSPDGSLVITTEGAGLSVRKAQTGALVGKSPLVANADMPDLSPDGKQVVFARGGAMCQLGFCVTLSVSNAGLFTASFNGQGFGAEKQLVAGGASNNYYPAYSPDGAFVVFNRSAGDSYDAPDAKLMVVAAAGGKPPIDLASVNAEPGNSWPKWGPFIQHFQGKTIYWLTFSSRRAYGLVQPMSGGKAGSQLWMVPVDVAKLQAGQDPGYPAIWMPFQDVNTGNHIAQWVETVQRAPCSQIDQSGCMQGEMCENGVCVPGIQ